jgi:hypothetical protein
VGDAGLVGFQYDRVADSDGGGCGFGLAVDALSAGGRQAVLGQELELGLAGFGDRVEQAESAGSAGWVWSRRGDWLLTGAVGEQVPEGEQAGAHAFQHRDVAAAQQFRRLGVDRARQVGDHRERLAGATGYIEHGLLVRVVAVEFGDEVDRECHRID